MVVLCDEFALADDSNWSALLRHARSRNLLTSTEPEVVLMPPSLRPLTHEEAFDEEQEKLASLLQSLLRPSVSPSNMREATDQDEANLLKSTKRPSSASSQSSRSVRSKPSSSRSPRSPGFAKAAKPQKPGPINALFSGVERLPGA